jgi:lipopolysaccharide cholinephosphotransferase
MIKYSGAQKDALDILGIVADLCRSNDIPYSIIDASLGCMLFEQPFENMNPNSITITLFYRDYLKLVDWIKTDDKYSEYRIVDCSNTAQFDMLGCWLCKPNRVKLPGERKADEYLYWTHLTILPVICAGNIKSEAKRQSNNINNYLKLLNARMPLPKKRLLSDFSKKYKRLKAKRYALKCRKMKCDIHKLIDYYVNRQTTPAKYAIFPSSATHYQAIEAEQMMRLKQVNFYGIDVLMFENVAFIYSSAYLKKLRTVVSKKESCLKLNGGEDLRRIQLIQLEMLIAFDQVARKYNLKYNLSFGSLLGAVRHKGFIPWDDDIDINMPYEDYVRLLDAWEKKFDTGKYYLRSQANEKDCNITFSHLKRNGTVYKKPGRDNFYFHPGVFIDIVPLFNGAPNFFLHKLHTRVCWFFRTACWAYIGADSEKKFHKRIVYKLMSKIGNKRAYRKYIKFATMFKVKREKMAFFNGLDRSPYNIGFVKRSCFDKPGEVEFEGHKFWAPSNITEVMEYCFGKDYMRYPPLRSRMPKNNAIIDIGDLYQYEEECK